MLDIIAHYELKHYELQTSKQSIPFYHIWYDILTLSYLQGEYQVMRSGILVHFLQAVLERKKKPYVSGRFSHWPIVLKKSFS